MLALITVLYVWCILITRVSYSVAFTLFTLSLVKSTAYLSLVGEQMSVRSREEGREASLLIDLTSRSPSPLPAPSASSGTMTQRAVPIQLSTYAQPAQTRVNKTGSPHLLPVHDNHSAAAAATATGQSGVSATPLPNSSSSSSFASASIGTSPPQREVAAGEPAPIPLHSTGPTPGAGGTISAESGSGSTLTATSSDGAGKVPLADEVNARLPSSLPMSAPQDQSQVPAVSSLTNVNVRSQDSAPPALVEYITSPANGSDGPHETPLPEVKSEPLQLGTDLAPRELPPATSSSHQTSHTSGQNQSSRDEVPVGATPELSQTSTLADTSVSGRPPKVGVASIQVGVVLPENSAPTATTEGEFPRLRMASSVGGEESEGGGEGEGGEGGGRVIPSVHSEVEEEEEEEDEESVMELRIEDSVMEAEEHREDGERGLPSQTRVGVGVASREGERGRGEDGGGVRVDEEDLVMDTESHSNSIGTSPPPPSSQTAAGGIRVNGQAGVEARVRLTDGQRGRGAESVVVKYPKPPHYRNDRPTGSHGNTNSLLMKGSVATVSPSLLQENDRGTMDERVFGGGRVSMAEREKGGMVSSSGENVDIPSSYRVRKVAKVKQFFTTLQRFGDRQSSEVAEQVQELIAALVVSSLSLSVYSLSLSLSIYKNSLFLSISPIASAVTISASECTQSCH